MGKLASLIQTNCQSRISRKYTKFEHSEKFPLVNVPEMKIHNFPDDEKSKKSDIEQ